MKSAEDDGTKTSRTPLRLIVNLVVSSIVLAGCLYGYSLLGERKRPARDKPAKPDGTVVTTETLTLHEGPVVVSANGVVVPLREIRLATEVAGRIIEQSEDLRAGRMVNEGETLIRLDPAQYELELRRLQAQQSQETAELAAMDISVENTRQLLGLASEQVDLANEERQRIDSLVKRQAASVAEVDIAKRSALTAKAALVELENRRRDFEAQRNLISKKQALTEVAIERAQLDLDRTVVRAPLTGRVVMSMVEEQSFVAAGTPFVVIEDTSVVEVRSNLTVDQMYRVWNSTAGKDIVDSGASSGNDRVPPVPATIQYNLGSRVYQWQAVLERIDGAGIDAATRTYPCLFRVDAPEQVSRLSKTDTIDGPRRLIRGMFVSVQLQAESRRQLVQCSEMAIRPGNRVWVNVDGKMRVVPVEIVGRIGDRVVIDAEAFLVSGLPKTLDVVVSPVSDPHEGLRLIATPGQLEPPGTGTTPQSRIADESSNKPSTGSGKAAG